MLKVLDLTTLEISNLNLKPEEIAYDIITANPKGMDRRVYLPRAEDHSGTCVIFRNRSRDFNISVHIEISQYPAKIINPESHIEIISDGFNWFFR